MLFTDTYHMLQAPAEGVYKDKGSKFMSFSFPVMNEEEVKLIVGKLKKEHFAAAHHCYAFVTGYDQEFQKVNDDREPGNTAGKPILRAILAHSLTNTLVVVVRYFGGKLLGIPGLIEAYSGAAQEALKNSHIIQKIVHEQHELTLDAAHEHEAFRIIKQYGLKILQHHHSAKLSIVFEIRKSMAEQVIRDIRKKHFFDVKFIKQH